MSRKLGEAFVRVRPDYAGFGDETEQGVQGELGGTGSAITSTLKKAVVAGAVVTGAAAGAAIKTGLSNALDIQSAKKTLSGLYGSAAQATAMMTSLRRVASSSPIDYSAYTSAAESLAYMGIKGRGATQILKNVGAAVTAAGGGSEEIGRATDAMLKMVNAGKVQLDTLNQLSNSGTPIFSALAAHFNTNIAHVREMVTAGKVGIDDVTASIRNAEGATFKQMIRASESASSSVQNQWTMLKDNLGTTLGTLFLPALKPLGEFLVGVNQRLTGLSDRVEKTWAPRLRDALESAFSGVDADAALDRVGQVLQGIDWDSVRASLSGVGEDLKRLGPFFKDLAGTLPGVSDVFSVFSEALSFAADHVDLLRKAIPYLIAAFVAYKVAVIAARLATAASIPIRLLEVQATRAHTKALLQHTATTKTATVAEQTNTTANKAGLLTSIRQRVAIVAKTVAQKAAAVATKGMAIAQRLLNAAMRANPLGVIITLLAAVAAGVIYAYKHSSTFRKIVQGAWKGIQAAASFAWNKILKPVFGWLADAVSGAVGWAKKLWRMWGDAWGGIKKAFRAGIAWVVDKFLGFAQAILNTAAKAMGWIPGLGPKIKRAAGQFRHFRDKVNEYLRGVKDKKVSVRAHWGINRSSGGLSLTDALGVAASSGKPSRTGTSLRGLISGNKDGGPIRGPGGPRDDEILSMLSNGEYVLAARTVDQLGGFGGVDALVRAAQRGETRKADLPAFRDGGGVDINSHTRAAQLGAHSSAAALDRLTQGVTRQLGSSLQVMVNRVAKEAAAGGPFANAQRFALAQRGKPYIWGGVGPAGYDCSGFMSAITNVLRGQNPYSRLGATATFPWAGFSPGPGGFTIGSTRSYAGGVGHMAGTLAGLNVESAGGVGVRTGPSARGYRDPGFTTRAHVFDGGGLARGSGILAKGLRPERVLSTRQTEAFERLVDLLDRGVGGGDVNLTVNAGEGPSASEIVSALDHEVRGLRTRGDL